MDAEFYPRTYWVRMARKIIAAYFDALDTPLVSVSEVETTMAVTPSYEVSDRGLKYYEPISTCYGHVVNVYESSSAGEPRIWLSFDAAEAVTDSPATALLSIEQVAALQATLAAAVANTEAKPSTDLPSVADGDKPMEWNY